MSSVCAHVVVSKLRVFSLFIAFLWTLHGAGGQIAKLDGRIVNGTQAQDGEFPYIVSLRRASSGRHSCGASILNRVWVLTAAHCVSRSKPEQLNIQYGDIKLDPNTTRVVNVSSVHVHEGYQPSQQYIHDIALLRLQKPLEFDSYTRAVRLPEMLQSTPGDSEAVLIGWGLNATAGEIQENLQKVYLQTFTDEDCSARHETAMHETNICAGVPEGGKGQCSGDSGGPLLVNGTQVGIVSWSRKPCTVPPYPGVFTEVSAYVDWILKTINEETLQEPQAESHESWEELSSGNLIIVSLRRSSNNLHLCAGTIITPRWILTAAHCFTYIRLPQEVRVHYGSVKLKGSTGRNSAVQKIIRHDGYNPTVAIHDIALMLLEKDIIFDSETQAVKLMVPVLQLPTHTEVLVIGWGLNGTTNYLQNHLQKVQLKLLSLTECRKQLHAFIHDSQLCASVDTPETLKGHCSGDSGGPLLQQNVQLGIVSWSFKPCGTTPGVYTNVSYYIGWIKLKIDEI